MYKERAIKALGNLFDILQLNARSKVDHLQPEEGSIAFLASRDLMIAHNPHLSFAGCLSTTLLPQHLDDKNVILLRC